MQKNAFPLPLQTPVLRSVAPALGFVSALALASACGDDGEDPGVSEGEGEGSSDETGDEGSLPAEFRMTGRIVANQAPGVEAPPLMGGTVCIRQTELCTTTDDNGEFVFEAVPNGLTTWLEISAPEHLTGLLPFHTNHEDLSITTGIWPRGALALVVASIGQTIDDQAGHVVGRFQIQSPTGEVSGLTGYDISISPDSGVGPVFAGTDGIVLGGESTSGTWAWGNLPAGTEYTISFSHPDYDCPSTPLEGDMGSPTQLVFTAEPATVISTWDRTCVSKGGDGRGSAERAERDEAPTRWSSLP